MRSSRQSGYRLSRLALPALQSCSLRSPPLSLARVALLMYTRWMHCGKAEGDRYAHAVGCMLAAGFDGESEGESDSVEQFARARALALAL